MLNIPHDMNKKIVRTTLTAVIFYISYNIFSPYLTPFLLEKGFNKEEISLIIGISYVPLIFISAISGKISDVIGRKKMISYSIVLLILSILTFIVMDNNYLLLIVATSLYAISCEVFSTTAIERIEDNADEETRGKITGVYESLRSLGALVGTLIGAYLITFTKIATVFKLSLLLFIIIYVFGLFIKSGNHNKISRDDFNYFKELKEYWSHRGLRGLAIIGMAKNFSAAATTVFVPLLIIQELHANIAYIGLFVGAVSVSQLTQFYFGKLCDIRGSARICWNAVFVYSISISLLFFATSPLMILLTGLLMGLSLSAWNTSADCFMSKIGEEENKEGQITGSYVSFAYIGVFLGYIVSGYLTEVFNTRFVFLLYGFVGIISVIIARNYMFEEKHRSSSVKS